MFVSSFDLFKPGLGPSSSHTVGPMRAARDFALSLDAAGHLARVSRIKCLFYGSLGATGRGHASDRAVILGLLGETPDGIDPAAIEPLLEFIRSTGQLRLLGRHAIAFTEKTDLLFKGNQSLPFHPNAMKLTASAADGSPVAEEIFYSVGGGFIVREAEANNSSPPPPDAPVPYPFDSAVELLRHCRDQHLSFSGVMLANEESRRPRAEVFAKLRHIWDVMQECVRNGYKNDGILPGGLKVPRRAPALHHYLQTMGEAALRDPLTALDWVNLYAIATNEENAAGGRVVTAPTNGAAGIIPAVLHYAVRFCTLPADAPCHFLLAAAAVGGLYKKNASISGADVGCQGEVGVACSMAAAGLAEVMGGTPEQVENAAEIGMEHNLGLTCDPIKGLVQIPCIERNAVGAVKAINAARLALRGDGHHFVSLDKVIRTMRDTGRDMQSKYKETARGGLAVNVVEC